MMRWIRMALVVATAACIPAAGCKSSSSTEPPTAPVADPKAASDRATVTMTPEALAAAGVKVAPVSTAPLIVRDDVPGTIEAQTGALVIVNNRAAGVVESLDADVGDRVKAGQRLATIRSLDLAEAQAAYRRATVSDKFAVAALERSQVLKREGVISQRRLDADQLDAQERRLARDESAARIRILGGGTGDLSGVTSITAPIAGSIAERKANRGESIAENSPMFTVVDVSRIVVQLRALGGMQVAPGTEVRFTIDALPTRQFTAVVTSSSDVVDPETRRLFVRCAVDNPDGVLKPGMFVTGQVPHAPLLGVSVPESAIQVMDGKPTVFVAGTAGELTGRPVVLGPKADGRVAVTQGLAPGDRVVIAGGFFVRTEMQKSELEE